MPSDPLALSTVPSAPLPQDTEYDAICTAMAATTRGRWFLDEYARRNRNCDTNQVLDAIARMEASVVDSRAKQASQEVRLELLEMARTIAQARADVAVGRGEPSHTPVAEPAVAPASPEIAAVAERLRQIAWTVRACGIDLPACDQIGEIAEMLLSARALRNLGNQQTQKLAEVLHYLEHRIDGMLDSQLAAGAAEPTAPRPRQTKARDPADDGFPLALTDMTAANTNEAEAAAARAPVLPTHAEVAGDGSSVAAPAPQSATSDLVAHHDQAPAAEIVAVEPPPSPTIEVAGSTTPHIDAQTPQEPSSALGMTPAPEVPVAIVAVPAAEPLPVTVPSDAIAAQVDHDLDDLTDFAAPGSHHGAAAPQVAAATVVHPTAALPQPGDVVTTSEDDPADFLFEAPPQTAATPIQAANPRTAHAAVPDAQLSSPQMSTVLAAIATELLAENNIETRARMLIPGGALALLMAMSEEERIALFS
jgi:hypothetical protein